MPLPKRRHSNQRTRLRRTHYKLTHIPVLTECPRCGAMHERHHVCKACGYYRDRHVLDVKQGKPVGA